MPSDGSPGSRWEAAIQRPSGDQAIALDFLGANHGCSRVSAILCSGPPDRGNQHQFGRLSRAFDVRTRGCGRRETRQGSYPEPASMVSRTGAARTDRHYVNVVIVLFLPVPGSATEFPSGERAGLTSIPRNAVKGAGYVVRVVAGLDTKKSGSCAPRRQTWSRQPTVEFCV